MRRKYNGPRLSCCRTQRETNFKLQTKYLRKQFPQNYAQMFGSLLEPLVMLPTLVWFETILNDHQNLCSIWKKVWWVSSNSPWNNFKTMRNTTNEYHKNTIVSFNSLTKTNHKTTNRNSLHEFQTSPSLSPSNTLKTEEYNGPRITCADFIIKI